MTGATIAEKAEIDYPLIALLRQYGRSDGHYFVVAAVAGAISNFLSYADVFLIGLGIDALFNDRAFAVPFVPSAWVPAEPLPLLGFVTVLLVALNLLTNLGGLIEETGFGVFTQRFLHTVRVNEFDAVQRLELGVFDESRTGNVISVLNDDVNQLDTFLNVLVGASIWIVVTLVSAFVYMAVLNWQLALFVLLAGPIVAGINLWFSKRLEPLEDRVRTERGALNARLETNVSGTDVVKSFAARDHERERVEAASHDLFRARFASRRTAVWQEPANRLVAGTWLLLTLALGTYWVVEGAPLVFTGTLTAGELVPFLFYMERITLPLKNLGGVVGGYKSAKASAKRIEGLTNVDERRETDADRDLEVDGGSVAFQNVGFSYPDSDRRVVDDVDFSVAPGETVGIVGSTGAGKSTLVKLLLRFYEADEGIVAVDGQDVDDVSLESLRDAIGYVNQDAYLFDGTVRYNIAYGADDASDGRVEAAAREAGAHRFVAELPDGYDTEVGENGTKLSGGQRQRVAIARAIVDDPPILVFDEATSHVDNETELVLQEKLDELTRDRTTFVVAHRLSTVRGADRILVLDDGAIVEEGTHEALVDQGGTYATLWNVQVGNLDALSL